MIKHIVIFKLKSFDNDDDKQANLIKMKSELESLTSSISEIKYLEVGLNYNETPNAFDLILITEFASKKDLQTYSTHVKHLKVVDFVKTIAEDRKVVDFEC